MKDNKYKNTGESKITELNSLINLLVSLNERIELYAMGGTAMVLAGQKPSTRDIDFMTTLKQKEVRELFNRAGLEETDNSQLCNKWDFNTRRLDIFYETEDMILGFPLSENWKEKSIEIEKKGKVKIFILNWEDIISTKLARGETRDFEDILKIINNEKIDFGRFEKEFKEKADVCAGNTMQCYENLKHLKRKIKNAKI